MARRWTEEQRSAIEAKRCSILVAAAAGAGKTAVLVQRIIDAITAPAGETDIDNLLVVTFTNAAAAEMRERIGGAIEQKLHEAVDQREAQRRLQRQLTLLNRASITTIHSFCLEVIRANFNLLELDPKFRIGDETETTLIQYEALEEIFEESYGERGSEATEDISAFLRLVDCYSGRKDDLNLQEQVMELYRFMQSSADPERWLEESCGKFAVAQSCNFGETIWAEVLRRSVAIQAAGAAELLQEALEILNRFPELEPYRETMAGNFNDVRRLCAAAEESWEAARVAVQMDFGRLKAVKTMLEEKEVVQKLRKEANEIVKKIRKDYFGLAERNDAAVLGELYGHMSTLASLVCRFGQRYAEKKKEKNLLDFNDMEHFCLTLLKEEPEICAHYREKYHEIFVDEYQDSNLVQEEIIQLISRAQKNIFMVGDVKQSIYRFRQAKPELFMEKYRTYREIPGQETRLIKLFKNFRSRRNVINSVNFTFQALMSQRIGEVEYDDREALIAGATYAEEEVRPGDAVEFHILNLSEADENAEEDEERADQIQAEARMLGDVIRGLVRPAKGQPFQVYDVAQDSFRDVTYRDIVILLRATTGWADKFVEELRDKEIPAYADAGTGYFRTVEVLTMLSLLTIIDNPRQDIPLLAVLRSPIGGFTAEELIDIREVDREADFYTALEAFGQTAHGEKARAFLEQLSIWRNKSASLGVDELIWYLFDETNYYSFVGALVGGTQRQANLRILFQRAKQFENTNYKGLFAFLNFINKMKARSGDMGSAKLLTDSENVVRIMSIHKSKGLEFPVVILAGTGKQFNMMDSRKKILLHQALGFGPQYISSERRVQFPSAAKIALGEKIKNESLSEEMRVLYVAMTRAKEKLIVTGAVKDLDRARRRWSANCITKVRRRLSPSYIMKAKGYLDWLAPIFAKVDGCESFCIDDTMDSLQGEGPIATVRIYSKQEMRAAAAAAEENRRDVRRRLEERLQHVSAEVRSEVDRKLSWQYPYAWSTKLAAKKSVSEMKQTGIEEVLQTEIKKPAFLEGQRAMSAAEKGSAVHLALQHLNFQRLDRFDAVEDELTRLVIGKLLREEQSAVIPREALWAFAESALGQRMRRVVLKRETPFAIELPCEDCEAHSQAEPEFFMLQGIIDCYFIESDGAVLIDYKTGRMRESYRLQLSYYALALERAGIHVKERYIVFLPIDKDGMFEIVRID